MRNLGVLASKVQGEYLKSDVDHARRRAEQIARNVVVLFDHRILGSSRPAQHALKQNTASTGAEHQSGEYNKGCGTGEAAAAAFDAEERTRNFGDGHAGVA
jgi:hypothetical protein